MERQLQLDPSPRRRVGEHDEARGRRGRGQKKIFFYAHLGCEPSAFSSADSDSITEGNNGTNKKLKGAPVGGGGVRLMGALSSAPLWKSPEGENVHELHPITDIEAL